MTAIKGTMIQHLIMTKIQYELTENVTEGSLIAKVIDNNGNESSILISVIEEYYRILEDKFLFSSNSERDVYKEYNNAVNRIEVEMQACRTSEEKAAVYKRWFVQGTQGVCNALNKLIDQNNKMDSLLSRFKV